MSRDIEEIATLKCHLKSCLWDSQEDSARATPQQSMWPLEKYCPRLILNHQSWVTQWSQIQHLGLIVCPSLWQRWPFSKGAHGPYASMVVWGKSLSAPWTFITPGPSPRSPTPGPLLSSIQLLSQPLGSKGGSSALSPANSCSRRVVGKSWGRGSGNEMRSRERVSWAQERAGGRRPPLRSVLLSMAVWAFLCFLYPLRLSRAVSSFLLHTLKSVGYRGVLNLKLCKHCQISVHSLFLILLFILFPFETCSQYWWPSASVSPQQDLNLLLDWTHLHLGKYLPLYKTTGWLNP